MQPGVGSAVGKVILLGEHAVLYGVPALVAGLDRGVRATVSPLANSIVPTSNTELGRDLRREHDPFGTGSFGPATHRFPSRIALAPFGVSATTGDRSDLGLAWTHLLDACGVSEPVSMQVECSIAAQAGLGCSAAIAVAAIRALDPLVTMESVLSRAQVWENVFHAKSSGVDVAAAAMGGLLEFVPGDPPHLRALDDVRPFHLCVGNTGVLSNTKDMVNAVSSLASRQPAVVAKSVEAIRALVENGKLALMAGDLVALGRMMDLAQMLLSGLMVSSGEIEDMCRIAREAGALGAKLTGAGGGGSVMALVEHQAAGEAVLSGWKNAGFAGFVATCSNGAQP